MSLTVLNVAYPLAPVGPDAVGGAEQVLTMLDRALVAAGHRSIVLACAGSKARGVLMCSLGNPATFGAPEREVAERAHRGALKGVLSRVRVDLVHMHGVDFATYLPPAGCPVLATLHLPLSWYPKDVFEPRRPGTFLNCVSSAQQATHASAAALPVIENGVDLEAFPLRLEKYRFVMALGRICEEKGFHVLLDAARLARMPMLLGGKVFPYPVHERYFEQQIAPRLDHRRRFLGPVGGRRKQRLLGSARCLLVGSAIAETSSLVAMEALASGTPVVALRSAGLDHIVEPGRTGFLVDDTAEMAIAIEAAGAIDPRACRQAAERRFSSQRMAREYLGLYAALARPSGKAGDAGG